jgi:hypothetical protein
MSAASKAERNFSQALPDLPQAQEICSKQSMSAASKAARIFSQHSPL